jgi:hypothetical protein
MLRRRHVNFDARSVTYHCRLCIKLLCGDPRREEQDASMGSNTLRINYLRSMPKTPQLPVPVSSRHDLQALGGTR